MAPLSKGPTPGEAAVSKRRGRASRPIHVYGPPGHRVALLAKLAELKGWYDEWAATARAVVKKRVHVIRLGLAQRKPGKKGAADDGEPTGRA